MAILSKTDASQFVRDLHSRKETVVFTNGCFDVLHWGHVSYLKQAGSLGDALIVGVNSDESVTRLKGWGRPIQCDLDRARILDALSSVSHVVIFEEDTPLTLIRTLKPDILVKGEDYSTKTIVGADEVEKNGGQVMTIPLEPGLSTSELIRRIQNLSHGKRLDSPRDTP